MDMPLPEELDTVVPDKQYSVEFQLFTSLLHFGSGWFANLKGSFERSAPRIQSTRKA